jgi:hypothetical protein
VGAARAQVQQNDPNAANASLALQSQIRTLNQQRVTDFNTLNQSIQRNVQFAPYAAPLPYRGVYGGRVDHHAGRSLGHRGSARRIGGGVNTSVCIGC